ncbi:hypothetical protein ACP70R_001615 [Stipagrostis hirtigluma subsp. patula]
MVAASPRHRCRAFEGVGSPLLLFGRLGEVNRFAAGFTRARYVQHNGVIVGTAPMAKSWPWIFVFVMSDCIHGIDWNELTVAELIFEGKIMASRNEIVESRKQKIRKFMEMEEEDDDELFLVIIPTILQGLNDEKTPIHDSEYTGAKKNEGNP